MLKSKFSCSLCHNFHGTQKLCENPSQYVVPDWILLQSISKVKPGEHKDANILQKSSTWLTTPYGRKMCKDKNGIVALQTPVYC